MSHIVDGHPLYVKPASARPKRLMRSCMFSLSSPGQSIPATSPFTSAIKTGTPASLKDSAMTFRVTVLPVPVAPAMRPCLLAIFGSMLRCSPLSLLAIQIKSFVYMITSRVIPTGAKPRPFRGRIVNQFIYLILSNTARVCHRESGRELAVFGQKQHMIENLRRRKV